MNEAIFLCVGGVILFIAALIITLVGCMAVVIRSKNGPDSP